MDAQMGLDRRALLSRALLLLGATATPSEGWARAIAKTPRFLAKPQFALLSAIADTMIPQTGTPGALGAGVPALFDSMLINWASAAQRQELVGALADIDKAAGGNFVRFPAAKRAELLSAYDTANTKGNRGYGSLKELIVVLYYMSQPGSSVELSYEHSPGVWQPSLPVTPQTRQSGAVSFF